MGQVSMTIRLDSKVKAAFDDFCDKVGISANAAMNLFANAVVRQKRIPFEISISPEDDYSRGRQAIYALREEAQNLYAAEPTLEEINEEIRKSRQERKLKPGLK